MLQHSQDVDAGDLRFLGVPSGIVGSWLPASLHKELQEFVSDLEGSLSPTQAPLKQLLAAEP